MAVTTSPGRTDAGPGMFSGEERRLILNVKTGYFSCDLVIRHV